MARDVHDIMAVPMVVVVSAARPMHVARLAMRRIGNRGIGRLMRSMVMTMIMPAMIIRAALRLERPRHLHERATLTADHLGEDMVILDVERVVRDLGRRVAVADVPGHAHQPERALGADFEQVLRSRIHQHKAAIFQFQGVASVQVRGLVEIEQEVRSGNHRQHHAAALAVLMGQDHRAGDLVGLYGGFADNTGGAEHGLIPCSVM